MERRPVALGATLATIAGLGIVITQGLSERKVPEWWAAWGQWIGGIGSIAAAGVAVAIALIGWQRAERAASDQERRQLATLFGVWIEPVTQREVEVRYRNSSPLPVYEVEGRAVVGERTVRLRLGTLAPSDTIEERSDATATVQLAVAREAERLGGGPLTVETDEGKPYANPAPGFELKKLVRGIPLEITFRDGNGNRWRRTAEGKLEPLRDDG